MEAAGLQKAHWRKSSMWSMLVRKHAQAVVDDSEVRFRGCVTAQWLIHSLSRPANVSLSGGLGVWGRALAARQPLLFGRPPGGVCCVMAGGCETLIISLEGCRVDVAAGHAASWRPPDVKGQAQIKCQGTTFEGL